MTSHLLEHLQTYLLFWNVAMFMTFKKGTDYFSILIQNMKLEQYKTEKQFKCNTRASHYKWPMDKSHSIMHGHTVSSDSLKIWWPKKHFFYSKWHVHVVKVVLHSKCNVEGINVATLIWQSHSIMKFSVKYVACTCVKHFHPPFSSSPGRIWLSWLSRGLSLIWGNDFLWQSLAKFVKHNWEKLGKTSFSV